MSDYTSPLDGSITKAGSDHEYRIERLPFLANFEGRISVDWGKSTLAYVQRADRQEKPIIEILRELRDPDFPGFEELAFELSRVPSLPPTWISVLKATKGIYVLTCPRTKEMYIGQAGGEGGFFARWVEYAETGHGGNVQLKSRERSDYQVAVLEVAGSNSDLGKMESAWKQKFQTREQGFGLNSN